ncbi:pectate lyase family protein [Cellvibrio fontiphilus]|uniref:Pectate lyase domain-containing protein n=1 Tax=Cellvibrio fontiphilus TaxID=1815559 RepID=A0ABV7FBM8_9GAMM
MKQLINNGVLKTLSALCMLACAGNSLALDLNVVALNKLSETRIDRTTYDYVFSVTVKNGEQAITNAAQTLTASGAGTTILDGNVVIGDLASGEQITPTDTIKIRHNRATAFNPSALVWSASGTAVVPVNRVLFNETFDVDKVTLFSAAYKSISTDASAPLFFVTGGNSGITVANNQLTLAAARFTIGHKPPRANTTSGDTSANGDFDLSKPYRISFRVVAASGSGAVQVMVDNNTTSAGNSLHGSASRIFNVSANSLVAGQVIELQPTIGTANSFISLRTESSASVTIDDLVIEYLDDVVAGSSSSVASSVVPSSVAASSIAPSSVAPSSVAPSSIPASSSSSSAISSSAANQTSSSLASYNGALRPAKMEGFAAHAGVTGGAGGALVTVTTGTELNAALCSRATMSTPITILVNGTISHANTTAQGCNTQADVIEIKQMSNVSIIGVGTNALFEEIGIHVRDASNIILQNLHIRNVKKSGSPVSNGGDAIGMETNVNRVWIDHNWLEASGGEKDGYDSLLDMKAGVTNVTVSYNLFNDSSRAGLIGSSDSDNKNTNITFHHNWYKNIEQRTPLIRHALVHMYNNYWSNDRMDYMFHAINSRMNAQALVESNYFYNVNNPLIASDDSSVPGCWQTNNDNTVLPEIYYSRTVGNGALVIPQVVDGQLQSTCAVTVPYVVEMDAANHVPAIVMANVGVGKISGGGVVVTSSAASSSVASSAALSSTGLSSTAPSSTAPSSVAASSIAPSSVAASSEAASSEASSTSISSEASSSVAPVVSALINEGFAVDKNTLFSAAYQSISIDASAPLYFITGGGSAITIANNQLTLAGARFTIGNRPPRASTTASDTNANGDFDLTRPYRISFTVIAASGSGKMQVYVDNNTTSQGNSIHGANSKVYEVVANSLTAGQQVTITPAVGTGNSFIALRTESSASVTIDNLVLEYTDGAGVSSSVASSVSSAIPSSSAASVVASASSLAVSSTPSSAIASSISSASSSAPYIPDNINLSADCISIATNPNVNWRDTSLQTDQEIVECLSQSLGKAVGYGENAKGGFDPNGNSKLTIITKNSSVTVEQQLINALTDNAHNWIVFDKVEFAQPSEIGMYRQYCSNATVQSLLDASEVECIDYHAWCARKGFNDLASCRTEFFNKAMNKSSIPIRIPAIGSNKTLDGRGTEAYFIFSGFAIGKDADGVPTQTSQNVILTHLKFQGAGHTEDHYVDPDMIRSTGASQDIWIHKNTFDTTGDSAFDVKIGANHITMSFNRLVNVKRAVLHGSSDSRTINANITTTMHHNAFVTTDDSYMLLGNTLRRVPLLRRGKTHMFNNVFVNYRKEILSLRVGASAFLEDNAFVVNSSLQEKSSVEASLSEIANNYFKDISGGFFRNDRNFLWFGSGSCVVNEATKTPLTASNGTVADLSQNYNAASLNAINGWRFAAGQDLVDYVTLTAGKHGDAPFNSPLSPDRTYMEALIPVACQ